MDEEIKWTDKDEWNDIITELEDAFYPLHNIKNRNHVDDVRFYKMLEDIKKLEELHDDVYYSELEEKE